MARFGPKLEREQVLLGRFVDIATEIFAVSTTCARAHQLGEGSVVELADFFATCAELRIDEWFHAIGHNADRAGYRVAQDVLRGRHEWVETGMLREA
jgi:hypothetical protein